VVIELGIIWSIVEIRGLEHRKKLRYSHQLPPIRSAEDTDKNAQNTLQLALASNTVFLLYLSLAAHRLKAVENTPGDYQALTANWVTFLQSLALFISLLGLTLELKRWLEHNIRLKSAN